MNNSTIVRERSLECEFYVSAFCATPRPSRHEEMTMIKKLVDDDKIPLLKAVVARVASVSDIQERSPVFRKLAEKFRVLLRRQETELKPNIVTSEILKEVPADPLEEKHLPFTSILEEVPEASIESATSSVISFPTQPFLFHHIEVATNIKTDSLQELPPVYSVSVKLEEVKDFSPPPPNSSVFQSDPLLSFSDIGQSSTTRNLVPNPFFEVCSSVSSPLKATGSTLTNDGEWRHYLARKSSPPVFPEKSPPPIFAKKSSPIICARKASPTIPQDSYPQVPESDPNQMLPVDPVTFLPIQASCLLNVKSKCVSPTEKSSSYNVCNQLQKQKNLKTGRRGTECWIVRKKSLSKQAELLFSCADCGESFDNSLAISQHKQHAHKIAVLLSCEDCGKSFDNSLAVSRHKRHAHKIVQDFARTGPMVVKSIPIPCDKCGRKCKSKKSLDKHVRRAHNAKSTVPCPENCGKMLTSRGAIKKHLLSHRPPGEWPVCCPLCKKRFQARADIPKHLLSGRHREDILPEVGSQGWWALIYEDRPEMAPNGSTRNKGN